ncbi:PAS domain S-box protein [Marinomonas balearica]|uniref:Sensor protein FixL n=1 Tax=Marinomonas balearica TaxID=491947 RepID=A0A4R6MCG4_9GAMM|nr:PAS domain S-box protein [Marinomonas balearica]TDO98845.1 PAS domain S-box-containing protein [Marinomonas balearica]
MSLDKANLNHIANERLASIINSSDDGIMSKTLEGIITSWNPAAEKIFGYTEEEAVGQPMLMIIPDDRKHEEKTILDKIARGERIEHFETIRMRKDGTSVIVSASISPIYDTEGNVCGASKIVQNITDKIAVRETQARFAAIINSSDDGIMSKTLDGIITSWNPSAERIFGYKEVEAIGQPMLMLFPKDKKHEEKNILAKIRKGERIDHYETERVRKDGKLINVSVTISPILDINGDVCGASKIVRDITKRIETEEELRRHQEHLEELVVLATSEVNAIIQTAVNGVISIDEKGTVHLFNPAAEKLFGWNADEVVGKNVSMLMPEMVARHHDGFLKHYIDTGDKKIIGIGREIVCLCKNGDTFPAHLAVGHTKLASGTHLFVAFIADISLQKKAEHELLMAKKNAELAAEAKTNFLANMSHEIRTPMNAVIGFSEIILQDEKLSSESRKYAKTILNSGKNLLAIINDILDFSKIEAGKIQIENICFNLINTVAESFKTVENSALEKGLKLSFKYHNELPKYYIGDPTRLRQVLLNLIGNAIKFTEIGEVSVSISLEEDSRLLHFVVTDSGIGMSQEQVDKVFESFTQADNSTTRKYGGTGLGTTISRQIVEMMGGRIWAESQKGVGSAFHFTIDFPVESDPELIAQSLYSDEASVESLATPRCFNVLLAEDIPENASLVTLRLEQLGSSVTWVKNGQEAFLAYQERDWDIILMDVQMPVLDGVGATKKIRSVEEESSNHIPIIALTASVMEEDKELCLQAGMDRVIGKPIDFEKLLREIEKVIPEGKGKLNSDTLIAYHSPEVEVDFSPLSFTVDVKKGLASWNDPLIYARALKDFADQHAKDAEIIYQLLRENNNDLEPAHRVVHALKGLSGNLALEDVFKYTDCLNDELKHYREESALTLIKNLDHSLKQVVSEITLLQIPESQNSKIKQAFNPEKIKSLLQLLVEKIDTLNPDEVEGVLSKLESYVDKQDLNPIIQQIENFEFDLARARALELADKVEIDSKD